MGSDWNIRSQWKYWYQSSRFGKFIKNCVGSIFGRQMLSIIGGHVAVESQFPWQIAIEYFNGHGYEFIGSGVIISNHYVLTAAHVFMFKRGINASQLRGIIGAINIHDERNTVTFSKIITHEKFSEANYENDISLLKTSQPMKLFPESKKVDAITLPAVNQNFSGKLVVSGWGQTEHEPLSEKLKYVSLSIVSDKLCENLYENYNRKVMLCAGHLKGERDSCYGDSGGPAIQNTNNTTFLVGIVSFGKREGCALQGVPAVYTRVSRYTEWIQQHMK